MTWQPRACHSCTPHKKPHPSSVLNLCPNDLHPRNTKTKFNFKPIVCVVTGAGRPGVVRQDALYAAASHLGGDTLEKSLGEAGRAKNTLSRRREQRGRNVGRGDGAGRPMGGISGATASNDEGAIRGRRDGGNGNERLMSMAGVCGKYDGSDGGDDTAVFESFEMAADQGADMVRAWWAERETPIDYESGWLVQTLFTADIDPVARAGIVVHGYGRFL